MKIVKLINNNIISSTDSQGREIIVMGKGLGFQAKTGQEIDESKIEKIFRMDSGEETCLLQSLLTDMPIEHIRIANEIIGMAKEKINKNFNKNIYITLTDHINFTIERCKLGNRFVNPLFWEISRLYPDEFQMGLKSVALVQDRLGIDLGKEEAASIALHFVNAEFDTDMPKVIDMTKILQNSLKIIQFIHGKELDEDSLDYARFLTHMKFFVHRVSSQKILETKEEDGLSKMIRLQYPVSYGCAQKIRTYVESEYHYLVSADEVTYLTIHIERITRN